MTDREDPYDLIFRESITESMRVLNTQIPRERKTLAELMAEKYPAVVCSDGDHHLFKKSELRFLSDLLPVEEQKELRLPILIRIDSEQGEAALNGRDELEEKVLNAVLGMPLATVKGKTVIYRRQLAKLRQVLRTTTQYVFSASSAV